MHSVPTLGNFRAFCVPQSSSFLVYNHRDSSREIAAVAFGVGRCSRHFSPIASYSHLFSVPCPCPSFLEKTMQDARQMRKDQQADRKAEAIAKEQGKSGLQERQFKHDADMRRLEQDRIDKREDKHRTEDRVEREAARAAAAAAAATAAAAAAARKVELRAEEDKRADQLKMMQLQVQLAQAQNNNGN